MFSGFFINDPMYMFTIKRAPNYELQIKVFNNSIQEANEALTNLANIIRISSTEDLLLAFADSDDIYLSLVDSNDLYPEPTLTRGYVQYIQSLIKTLSDSNINKSFITNDFSKYHSDLTMRNIPGSMSITLLSGPDLLLEFNFNARDIKPENFQSYLLERSKKYNLSAPKLLPIRVKYERLKELDPNVIDFDFPKEFTCNITLQLMFNPAKLAVSESKFIHFDYEIIKTWILINKTHPITRKIITVDDIQLDTEYAQKIEQYLADLIAAKEASLTNLSKPAITV